VAEAVAASPKSNLLAYIAKLNRFIRWHASHVREGGLGVLLLEKIPMLLGLVPAVLVVLAVRLLRPVVVIRFGCLLSSKIGQLAGCTEVYLCERDAGMHGSRVIDIFYHHYMYQIPGDHNAVCNKQLKKMFDRTLHVYRPASLLDWVNHHIPGGGKHAIPRRYPADRDIHGVLANTPPHFSLTAKEERLGRELLSELGIPEGAPFFCFVGRDSTYNDSKFYNYHSGMSYNNFRDTTIESYVPAAEELTRKGYYALRMGSVVKEPLRTSNPMVIDYATKHRTDFLDIYLSANCRFILSCGTGIDYVPMLFRRPVVFVHYVSIETAHTWDPNHLFIPKRVWLRKESRFMTFRELLDSGVGRVENSEVYEELGLELIENTPEEITAVTLEMDDRLQGTWQTTEEDEALQKRFWSYFKPSDLNHAFRARIGAEFLRQNRDLLELD